MIRSPLLRSPFAVAVLAVGAILPTACIGNAPSEHVGASPQAATPARTAGAVLRVQDTVIVSTFDASGVAQPRQQATLSTKLMGTVNAVLVREGDVVRSGQPLVRIDARDLEAKANQVEASIADAEAMQREAATHAARFRALYADSAATRAQFDAAMTGLARADAGLRAARAAASELDAVSSYATVRAPFAGVVTARFADPGTFASPGAPLLTVQDASTLRISASVGADALRQVKRGQVVNATIDGVPVAARIEGIVPANTGNQFTVNATVDNGRATFRAGSSATLLIPTGTQHALLVPRSAIVRDGDLTGVIVRGAQRDERRWIRLGATTGTSVDVTSGLTVGEEIVVPPAPASPKAGI